ncbi:MAG: 1-acyl-sn-glycerol-3-phosphate acyltransferase [Hydrogenibacillus schlegelii]|nr:1-acyl-sn-glycerol-3-phosphate acyltransferase [Hydrogenibacillus schlegelii]
MLYVLLKPIAVGLIKLYHRVEVYGREHVDPKRPHIVVSNHVSNLDPIYLAAFYPRPLSFMAKKELFQTPWLAWLIRALGAFPVDRAGRDLTAIRTALRRLKEGRSIGLFPEGTRSRSFAESAFKEGAAYFSIKSGVPVLPAALFGTGEAMPKGKRGIRPAKVRIVFGSPLLPRPGETPAAFAERIKAALQALLQDGAARGWKSYPEEGREAPSEGGTRDAEGL